MPSSKLRWKWTTLKKILVFRRNTFYLYSQQFILMVLLITNTKYMIKLSVLYMSTASRSLQLTEET
jgi:hypothetical protein